jgi:hypothetical protein
MLYIPSTAEDRSWTTKMAENTCTTSATAGTLLFPNSCSIQAYTFILPTAEFANQTAIRGA